MIVSQLDNQVEGLQTHSWSVDYHLLLLYTQCCWWIDYYKQWTALKCKTLGTMVVHTVHKGCRYQEYTTHMKNMN